MEKPLWMWAAFAGVVMFLLLLDLGVLNRNSEKKITVKSSLYYSLFYIMAALAFAVWVFVYVGNKEGEDFLTGYLVEKSLSMDNIFVMSLAFRHFGIPDRYQHRVLLYGIMGVLIMRGIMIGVGAELIQNFHWVLYLFGAFLVFTGIRILLANDEEKSLEESKLVAFLNKHMRVTPQLHGNRFFVCQEGKNGKNQLMATPLFMVLVFIELADAVFALDSVPAVFAITQDPFVVFTSNIFAILGLRALYFALVAMLHRFEYLKYSLSLVLIFIGFKIFLPLMDMHMSSRVSLIVTVVLLSGGVIFSLIKSARNDKKQPH